MTATHEPPELDVHLSNFHPAIKCHARRTNGQPCNNWARHGMVVCRVHGGSSPQAIQAAQVRLLAVAAELNWQKAMRRVAARQRKRAEQAAAILGISVDEVTDRHLVAASALEEWTRLQEARDGQLSGTRPARTSARPAHLRRPGHGPDDSPVLPAGSAPPCPSRL